MITRVIIWFKYCTNNQELQQTNNFPNNYGHINPLNTELNPIYQ